MSDPNGTKTYALKKAVAFSAFHFVVGMSLAFILTGQWAIALGVALIEPVINAGIIYAHSRWEFRRAQPKSHRQRLAGDFNWKTSLA